MNKDIPTWINWLDIFTAFGILAISFGGVFFIMLFFLAGGWTCASLNPYPYPYETFAVIAIIIFAWLFRKCVHWLNAARFLPAITALIVNGVLFLLIAKSIETAITEEPYYADFNADEWHESLAKPLPMVRVLLKENSFIGLTKEEVINKYGKPDSSYKGLYYNTTDSYLDIVLVMKNDTITRVDSQCND